MKLIFNHLYFAVFITALCFPIISCTKDNDIIDDERNNPIENNNDVGIEYNLMNNDKHEIIKVEEIIEYYIKSTGYSYTGNITLYIGINNINFHITDGLNSLYATQGPKYAITSIGKKKNLSSIKEIPESGWTTSDIAVQPSNGYIIRCYNGDCVDTCNIGIGWFRYLGGFTVYARIFVKDWIKSTSGEILGATIIYDNCWKRDVNYWE